ncbi:MAG: hypothetical protein K1X86_15420 [Ignavibacteria bacterium]|nr:hypothetical protein [Ignavibacteria bacterium]
MDNFFNLEGREFYFAKVTLGQLEELQKEFGLEVKNFTEENFREIVTSSLEKACTFFAIVLNEKDVPIVKKNSEGLMEVRDYKSLAVFLKYNLDDEKVNELMDFFSKYGSGTLQKQKSGGGKNLQEKRKK